MFEIGTIREQLNELAFENGKRAVSLGFISELFPDTTTAELASELKQLEQLLNEHDLTLERGGLDSEELYAVQALRYRDADFTWMAQGVQWVSKITTVALEMVVPVVIGIWLDQKFGTRFLGVLGILLGLPLGIWHLLKMTKHSSTSAN